MHIINSLKQFSYNSQFPMCSRIIVVEKYQFPNERTLVFTQVNLSWSEHL